jgi:hypothetical protein
MTALQPKDELTFPFELSLRIRHPSIDPAAITKALAIEPEHSFKVGEEHRSSRGAALKRSESYWLATLTDRNYPVKAQFLGSAIDDLVGQSAVTRAMMSNVSWSIARWLLALSGIEREQSFFSRLRKEGGRATLLMQLSPAAGTFTLSPESAKIISELGIELEMDVDGE